MEIESQNQQLYLLIKIKGHLSGGPHILKIAEILKFEIIPYIGLKYRIFENGPDFGLFWRFYVLFSAESYIITPLRAPRLYWRWRLRPCFWHHIGVLWLLSSWSEWRYSCAYRLCSPLRPRCS